MWKGDERVHILDPDQGGAQGLPLRIYDEWRVMMGGGIAWLSEA